VAERFVALPEVRRLVVLSKTEIYRRMARGEFPRPVSLGGRRVAWLASEVERWMQARVAERDAAARAS